LGHVVPRRCFDEGIVLPQEVSWILGIHVKTVRRYLREGNVAKFMVFLKDAIDVLEERDISYETD